MQEEYIHWKERVFEHITTGKPELGALLIWAQEHKTRITEPHEQEDILHNISANAVLASSEVYSFLGCYIGDSMRPVGEQPEEWDEDPYAKLAEALIAYTSRGGKGTGWGKKGAHGSTKEKG
jgi:hypothetical protein